MLVVVGGGPPGLPEPAGGGVRPGPGGRREPYVAPRGLRRAVKRADARGRRSLQDLRRRRRRLRPGGGLRGGGAAALVRCHRLRGPGAGGGPGLGRQPGRAEQRSDGAERPRPGRGGAQGAGRGRRRPPGGGLRRSARDGDAARGPDRGAGPWPGAGRRPGPPPPPGGRLGQDQPRVTWRRPPGWPGS